MVRRFVHLAWLAATSAAVAGSPAVPPSSGSGDLHRQYPSLEDPRFGLLTPVPESGSIPPIVQLRDGTTPDDLARVAEIRGYRQELQQIRRRHFRNGSEELRREGLVRLRDYTDPAALLAMFEVFSSEGDELRGAVLDHLAACGEGGQLALSRIAIRDPDEDVREQAMRRMTSPAPPAVLWSVEQALRGDDHQVASNAAVLSSSLNALEMIPLLIAGQVSFANDTSGDLAWIAVQSQTVYIQRLEAVTGNASGAYVPVPAVLNEGFVLRVQDAVVVIYRVAVHHALVTMTSYDWGRSTAHLGYDQAAWRDWYTTEYVPFKNEQRIIAELAGEGG